VQTPKYPTGAYLAAVDSVGELIYAMDDMRAISTMSPSFLENNVHLFEEASLLFVDANLPKPTLRKAFSLARKSKLPICADPTSVVLADRFLPYLSRLWMVTPNCHEAEILCDRTVEASDTEQVMDAAKCLVGQGVNFVILTLAQFGVCYATSETHGQIPAILTDIVDPTGGGDALTGAVIFALLNEIPFDDAIRLGVSAAALTLRYPGAVDPNLSLERLYDQLVI
jgi:pseudouridine kinase